MKELGDMPEGDEPSEIDQPRIPPRLFTFNTFDPLVGDPPDSLQGKFWDIARRARAILAGRSRGEVIAAADIISWLSVSELLADRDERQFREFCEQLENGEQHSTAGNRLVENDGREFLDVAYLMDRLSLEGLSDEVSNLSWGELFAVLALGVIDDAAEWEGRQRPSRRRANASYYAWHWTYAVEAVEAVAMAEGLSRQERVQQERRGALSSVKQRAAFERHRRTNQLKREVIGFFSSGQFPSYAEAARQFYQALPADKKKWLAPTNAVRTLTQALSDYHKPR